MHNNLEPSDAVLMEKTLNLIGDTIKQRRLERGLSINVLAEQLGMSNRTICRIEKHHDEFLPSLTSIVLLANALDLRMSDIFKEV